MYHIILVLAFAGALYQGSRMLPLSALPASISVLAQFKKLGIQLISTHAILLELIGLLLLVALVGVVRLLGSLKDTAGTAGTTHGQQQP